ncbi:MAG: cysteine desulfuration protein SufE [Verrucomicrobia bacterium]|jgi:cysteine desulfuration protein SufE|nr:MAG: cysteine desulfuration protein SufE [Verrucomicrobiota bacterium]
MPFTEHQQQLLDDLLIIEDAQERLGAVVDNAKQLPPLPAVDKTDQNRVTGCISQVWVLGELRADRCCFRCDADGPLVKGLVAFLCAFYSGATPAEIAASTTDAIESLGLLRNLSPTRVNGLTAVRARIRELAAKMV